MDVCGGCERIRNTPMATSMRSLIRAGIALYTLLAPWSLAPSMGFWSLPPLALGLGLLLGLEITAEELEEPFGHSRDDLPLDAFCRGIEQFVADTFDSTAPLPAWIEPLAAQRSIPEAARE
jgi:putative membrane protein